MVQKCVFLGEIFNSPYTKKYMIQNAENFNNSPTLDLLR